MNFDMLMVRGETEDGEKVEGYFCYKDGAFSTIITCDEKRIKVIVKTDSIRRCTGAHDKHDRLIYEGNSVQYPYGGTIMIGKVTWNEYHMRWAVENEHYPMPLEQAMLGVCEVVTA